MSVCRTWSVCGSVFLPFNVFHPPFPLFFLCRNFLAKIWIRFVSFNLPGRFICFLCTCVSSDFSNTVASFIFCRNGMNPYKAGILCNKHSQGCNAWNVNAFLQSEWRIYHKTFHFVTVHTLKWTKVVLYALYCSSAVFLNGHLSMVLWWGLHQL